MSRVSTAVGLGRAWAFSDRHAELAHALHYDDLAQLDQVAWSAMSKTYWSEVSEVRQAEFLVFGAFAWSAVHEIGTANQEVQRKVEDILRQSTHRPQVTTQPKWYY